MRFMMNLLISDQLVFVCLVDRCSLSIPGCYAKKKSVLYTDLLFAFVSTVCCISFMLAQGMYRGMTYEELINPVEWFRWCRQMIVFGVVSSIFNQLMSITIHRPIDILYDIRYISMISVQLLGFFICIMFAFCLGMKYAKINRKTDIVVYYNNNNCL